MAVIDRTTPEGRKFYAELRKLAELESYAGFQGGVETAKKREGDQIVDTDVVLLDVAAFNELGTDTTPSRPFLRQSLDNHHPEIEAFLKDQIAQLTNGSTTADRIMQQTSVFLRGLIQDEIVEGDFTPNAPSTVKKKGSATPLVDTGHMRQSVITIVDKKGRK